MPGRTSSSRRTAAREPLSRDRVVQAAVSVADEHGVTAVSMRNVAKRLGVEAMSLYHHVPNKEAILDGIVDAVFAEIDVADPSLDWVTAVQRRATSARTVLARHPWALGLMESRRSAGPATTRHHDAVLATLRGAGFSITEAVLVVSVLDSYVYGFVLQELQLPVGDAEEVERAADDLTRRLPEGDYPHVREAAVAHAAGTGLTADGAFQFGLDLILAALRQRRLSARSDPAPPPGPASRSAP